MNEAEGTGETEPEPLLELTAAEQDARLRKTGVFVLRLPGLYVDDEGATPEPGQIAEVGVTQAAELETAVMRGLRDGRVRLRDAQVELAVVREIRYALKHSGERRCPVAIAMDPARVVSGRRRKVRSKRKPGKSKAWKRKGRKR